MSQRSLQWRVLKEWANTLNSNSEWTTALEAALDDIGFTADYVREAKQASTSARPKAIKDSVWGMVDLSPAACMLLDSPLLQRLRFIKQLGFSYLTYPNATHSRFEHSLGTYWIARRLLDSAKRLVDADLHMARAKVHAICPSPENQNLICAAALLHDIGHGPFSHALERVVEENANTWRLGPFTVKQFTATMRQATLEVISPVKKIVPAKNFCELFAAAIVVSKRFQEFYEILLAPHLDAEDAVLSIASLLLGTPIETNAPGLSHVISGPIDADKLDYIVRDAQACGITISLDISRILFKAGFYRLSDSSLHPKDDALDFEDAPVEVFVIEQSGADGLRELAMSRLSLYARVYYHQCTRNAEQVFARSLHARGPMDFFDAWKLGDEEFLSSLRRNEDAGRIAQRLWSRRLPKRALALNADCYIHMDLPVSATILESINAARKAPAIDDADKAIDGLFSHGMKHPSLAAQINREFAEISRIRKLDVSTADTEWHTVPLPRHKDPTGTALCLSEDRTVETAERHLQQFIKSGEFPLARRYLFSSGAARISYALAVQKVLHRQGYRFVVQTTNESQLKGWFNPKIDLDKSCLSAKVPRGDLDAAMLELSRAGYYDDSPRLVSLTPQSRRLQDLAERFSKFHGGFGWKVNSTFIKRFIEQFPPKLRDEGLTLLEHLHVEDWGDFAAKTRAGIDQIVAQLKAETYWIVPLSFTSGTQICKALHEITVQLSQIKIEQHLPEAIRRSKEADAIIFVDDNIASGIQAESAMKHLAGQAAKREPSTYGCALSEPELSDLKSRSLGFAFAWGKTTGVQRLVRSCADLGFRIDEQSAVFISPLIDESPTVKLSDDLTSFLARVGMQLVAYDKRLDGETDKEKAYELGAERALGYGNAQGRLVGSYGVPSSTYTALFMPGMISRLQQSPWADEEYDQAWLPLFLRSQKAHRLVVA